MDRRDQMIAGAAATRPTLTPLANGHIASPVVVRAPEAETALAAQIQDLSAAGDLDGARDLFSQIVARAARRRREEAAGPPAIGLSLVPLRRSLHARRGRDDRLERVDRESAFIPRHSKTADSDGGTDACDLSPRPIRRHPPITSATI